MLDNQDEKETENENENENENATINTDILSFRVSPQHPQFSTSYALVSNSARQESNSPQDTEYEFILDFLNDLKPFAIRLQQVIMPSSSTLPPQPSSQSEIPKPNTTPRTKVPLFTTGRAACTHLTMERLYGDFTCNICSRFSNFGWLYCCTQDAKPESSVTPDSISEISSQPYQHINGSGEKANGVHDPSKVPPAVSEDPRLGGEYAPMPTAQLNPWIEKEIKDGHYTPEQVAKLRAQKQHVVDTARAAIDHFEQIQTNNTISPPRTPTTLQSVDAIPHLPFPVINEVREPSATSPPTANVTLDQQPKLTMFPFCKFCACQLCRPTYRDRAWQRFDDVFEKKYEIPFIHYEDRNRPLASASILSTMGLRPPRLRRPLLRSLDSRVLYSRNEDSQIVFNNNSGSYRKSADPTSLSTDIADVKAEAETKGFRESMKRAFKGMLMNRRPSSRSVRKRKAREGTDTTEEDVVEFDMGLWKELNDELLREASGVPLPGKDSVEGLSKEVAEMNIGGVGGIAVTEEAADLGRADVIMSV